MIPRGTGRSGKFLTGLFESVYMLAHFEGAAWVHWHAQACYTAEVAQSVEQGTENPRVGSSILSLGT